MINFSKCFVLFYTQNVIMQMLAVHPDLMSDQTPPPATQIVIDRLPQVTASQEHIGLCFI